MYAIVKVGGRQYKVAKADVLDVDRLPVEQGSALTLDKVLLIEEDGRATVGAPYVDGAEVVATAVRHVRGPKIDAMKYKPKKNYRRQWGHRQALTRIRVEEIRMKEKEDGT